MDRWSDWGEAMVKSSTRKTIKKLIVYVEGGGRGKDLPIRCAEGFHKFIAGAGIQNKPRVVACGTRRNAYDRYCTAIKNNEATLLLVDSEAPVHEHHQPSKETPDRWKPWAHLLLRDGWSKPSKSEDEQCHLMVQMMEHWFLADPETLLDFFKDGFNENALPKTRPVEAISKDKLNNGLNNAIKGTTAEGYDKGTHSFAILGRINAAKVAAASPWAKRFIDVLKNSMDA
jgi:hypothetical protein